ncbi:hypothetical protein K435DRAFT_774464, partial [Dendrothele bispora CBS 962.96]
MDELREHTEDLRMETSSIAAMVSCLDPPQPGLLDSFGQRIPLHDLEAVGPVEYTVEDDGLKTSNPRWEPFVSGKIAGPLEKMNANPDLQWIFLSSLTIQPGPVNCRLSVPKVDDDHYATAFVFLPTDSTSLRVEASYGEAVEHFEIEEDLSFSTQIFVCYTDIDHVKVKSTHSVSYLTYNIFGLDSDDESIPSLSNISPVVPELRDIFRTWKWLLQNKEDRSAKDAPAHILHMLESEGDSLSSESECDDNTLIAHLAPLAKAYGFSLLLVKARHIRQSEHEISHEYKEYEEIFDKWDDLERDLKIEHGKDLITYVDVKVTDLNEREVHVSKELKKTIEKKIEDDDYISHCGCFENRDHEVELEGVDTACYYDTLSLTHTRHALFLLVVPNC